ncbi:phage tail protein [Azospirillum soli]|uniref:phage tail protein n=1 Tax=Azospirillum soli TaxID=1304799 RepID=UPI001AEB5912|nr:tail fiber protein [Azospirillum soli]MBP2312714.1 microcystin-dependent protein [Azospirillum soli]
MAEPYVGEIRLFAGNFAPNGWHLCDGSLLAIPQYELLYALLGTTYGGDGRTTFGLPDLRGRLPIGTGSANGDPNQGGTSAYTLGQTGGATTVTLTEAQLPSHTHLLTATSTPATQTSPVGGILADPTDNFNSYIPYSSTGVMRVMANNSLLPAGGNAPHNNVMPTMPLTYIIALVGLYPASS